jgi:hypothetical protein
VISVVSYFGYRQVAHVDTNQPPGASGRADGRGGPSGASVNPLDAMASDTAPGKDDDSIQSVNAAAARPKVPLTGAAPVAANQPRERRQSVESRAARVATAPIARTKVTNEGIVKERVMPRLEACTEAVTALGLCELKPVQAMGREAASGMKPMVARSKAGDAGKAGRQKGRREEACTDGAAALGLCGEKSKQEGK